VTAGISTGRILNVIQVSFNKIFYTISAYLQNISVETWILISVLYFKNEIAFQC